MTTLRLARIAARPPGARRRRRGGQGRSRAGRPRRRAGRRRRRRPLRRARPAAAQPSSRAIRTRDGRVLRSTRLRAGFGVPLVAFDGTADGVSHDGRTLVLAQPYNAATKLTRFAALQHGVAPASEDRLSARALGVRRALAERPHALCDAVLRRRCERALRGSLGQPRHRPPDRRPARRPAGARRGDGRRAVVACPQRERRLGVHVLRQAERRGLRARARRRAAARVLRRPAVALDDAGALTGAPFARAVAGGSSSSRARSPASRSSTRAPSG